MKYNLAHFNWAEQGETLLITNDMGKYCFLSKNEFQDFIGGKLCHDTAIYETLESLGFLYQDREQYIADFKNDMLDMKRCLLTGTQLFIIVLTNGCNQRCVYCQAGEAHATNMPIDICKRCVDIAAQSPVSQATIEFQGGEPTLNPETLRFAIPYARKVLSEKGKKVDFALVTNLTHPDPELLRWLIEEGVHISTSLDGSRAVHEVNRPLASGKSSYDAWREGLELYKRLCVECGKAPIVSAIQTTTRASLLHPSEIVDEYLSHDMRRLYIRPLTPLGFARERWDEIGYSPEAYLAFYCRLLDDMLGRCKKGADICETTASTYLRRILNGESVGHTEFRSPCGAAVGQMAFNYDGYVYTCDEGRMIANMGDSIFQLGTVDNSYRELLQSPVAHAVCTASCIEGLPFCADCVYAPFCAVCPVVNYGIEGDLVSRDIHSYRCAISKGILTHLFDILRKNDPEDMEILYRWANDA